MFGTTRLDADYDEDATLRASQVPSAFPVTDPPRRDPPVAVLLPYGEAMARNSALLNVTRNADGVLRDVPLREVVGDWAIPSLALRLAAGTDPDRLAAYPDKVRIDWRTRTRLPGVSAANLLEGRHVCGDRGAPPLDLRGKTALVGYTAAGLNDAKPTPVDPTMAGVEVHAEATEALLAGRAIWMPPAWVKYLLAALLVGLTGYAFFRGEPPWELDALFVAANLLLTLLAFVGLSAFGMFFDIFAAMAFVALCFGACRVYAATQRNRAVGNDDYRQGFDPALHPWLAMARIRFVPDAGLDRKQLETPGARVPPAPAPVPVPRHRGGGAGLRRRVRQLVLGLDGGCHRAGLGRDGPRDRSGHGPARARHIARPPGRARRRAARRRQRPDRMRGHARRRRRRR